MNRGEFYDTDPTQPTGVDEVNREQQPLHPGDEVDGYTIKRKIGWGGCSTVYSAQRRTDGHFVAIKVMHPGLADSPRQVQRFKQEHTALRAVQHPTIVQVSDIGHLADGRPYMLMELLKGTNLAALLQTRGRFSPTETLEILRPICEALTIAHNSGIVHRDIKASNIIIEQTDSRRQVKLLDFGIAKLLGSNSGGMQTTVGHILGTPHSMAPEQIKGQPVDARTDIYALGALLYRMLTGKHPFDGNDAVTLTRMHIDTPVPPPSQSAPVSPDIDGVVRRAMEKSPRNRFDSAQSFIEALADAVGGSSPRVEESMQALALYVDVQIDEGSDNDDDALDDLMNILDIAEQLFIDHDILIPLQTGNAILGALLIPEAEAEDEVRQRVMELAEILDRDIGARMDADEQVWVNICLHRDEANVRSASNPPEIVGGAILDVGSWAPARAIEGVCATPETLGMALEARDGNARSYVRIGPSTGH